MRCDRTKVDEQVRGKLIAVTRLFVTSDKLRIKAVSYTQRLKEFSHGILSHFGPVQNYL